MRQRPFVTLDVFTSRRFTGNPLAIVTEAEGLDDATMQKIAREFGLPETVFVLAGPAAGRARIRIFTPTRELAFAGHPTIGAAVLLGALQGDGGRLVIEENVGPLACAVERIDGERGRARFTIPQEPTPGPDIEDAAVLAVALGLTLDDLGCDDFVPANWSAGNPMTFVPVRGLDAIARARPDPASWDQAFPPNEYPCAFLFCRETCDPGHDFHARMFAPALGIAEDAATGSAAAALAGLLAQKGALADGTHRFIIEQGYEMGRPSLLELGMTLRGGVLDSATVGGEAVRVLHGTIDG